MKVIPRPRKRPSQARSQHMVETILDTTARILAEIGYAGTNTNLVAARAGVSIGSIYQYFPNKDALIAAVHERHVQQMSQVIEAVLTNARSAGLRDHVAAIVRALLAAHLIEPELHQVLERELPFFDPRNEETSPHQSIDLCLGELMDRHQEEMRIPTKKGSQTDRWRAAVPTDRGQLRGAAVRFKSPRTGGCNVAA